MSISDFIYCMKLYITKKYVPVFFLVHPLLGPIVNIKGVVGVAPQEI